MSSREGPSLPAPTELFHSCLALVPSRMAQARPPPPPPPFIQMEAVAFMLRVYRGYQMPQFLVTFCCLCYIPDL